jgi:hypothetical protein
VVGGSGMILRRTSALEHLQLFGGYMHGRHIDVYSTSHGEFENVNYCVVDTFDGIDYVRIGDVLCTSVNQTVNDMLSDIDSIDEQPLVEGLSRYYYSSGMNFDGLAINPENMEQFNRVKDWAIEYYDEV